MAHGTNSFTTGGGINARGTGVFIIEDCLILNNTLSKTGTGITRGGALFYRSSEGVGYPRIINTTFSENSITSPNSGNEGAGLCIDQSAGNGFYMAHGI